MKKLLILLIMVMSLFSLTGCFEEILGEEYIYYVYGEEEAFAGSREEPSYFKYYDDNIIAYIDGTMDENYIIASIKAVEEFDALPYISISYEVSEEDYSEYVLVFTCYNGDIDPLYSNGDNDYGILAFNLMYYDDVDEENAISKSVISFNTAAMDDSSEELFEHVALHELGHTFGFVDFYDDIIEKYSVMYYMLGEIIFVDLTYFDKMNLEWMYSK